MLIKLFSFLFFSSFLFAGSVPSPYIWSPLFNFEILIGCDGAEVFNFFFSLGASLGIILFLNVLLIKLLKGRMK